jgi:GDP-4-dehydro-6-deoxy-D-mannose reductase
VRVLVTGASGFAGGHLTRYANERAATVVGLGRAEPSDALPLDAYLKADLTDAEAARQAVGEARPDWVFHLAALAHVGLSWQEPRETFDANLGGTLNLLEAVEEETPDARVLVVGSSEQYGPVEPEQLPVHEDEPFRPQNPYALSKSACDLAAGFHADARGLHVVRARAFNHAGPGQHERYVASSFARQIALAEAEGRSEVTVMTGDTRPRRDFTDVRDVVRAYWLMLERAPVAAYNVCSGRTWSAADILAAFSRLTDLEVRQEVDPAALRKNEVMEIRGSRTRLTEAVGWEPEVPFERTLEDALEFWRRRLAERVSE